MLPPCYPGPKPRNAAATRAAILSAARNRFAQENYENVGLREIARDAGVDASLIARYFGSKEALFKEVLRGGHDPMFEGIGNARELAELLARLAIDGKPPSDDGGQESDKILMLLRSAASPQASAIVQAAMQEDVLDPIARTIGGKDAEMRAGLAFSILLGNGILRSVCACGQEPNEAMRARFAALFAAALSDPSA